jgi:hypothetical protein
MIYLIVLIIIIVLGLGYQKFRGAQALTFTHIDVAGLSLEEIVAIGTRASGSLSGRMIGATPTAKRTASGAEWQAQIRGSVMSFTAEPLPDGSGYRVGGVATKMRIAQTRIGSESGIWGLSKAITNSIYRLLGIPHNAPPMVSRRKRVLAAISKAGAVIEPTPAAVPVADG